MKTPETHKVYSWHFKTSDDILDVPEMPKVITCASKIINGDACITLPSRLNNENYGKYGVVKPVNYLK